MDLQSAGLSMRGLFVVSPFLNNAKYHLRLRTAVAAMAMAILPLAFAPAQAQSASSAQGEDRITGVVVNAAGDYLRGAEVRVEGSDIVSVTDNDGRFTLQRVPGSTQQLSIAYFGYETGHVAAEPGAIDVRVALNAQTTDAPSDIVVSGSRPIAESEEAALQLKRSSTSLVDVIAADSAGRFPDQNIAAAVSRLPGVSVGRDQGQERYISLRGAPASWTTLAFDGVNVISPAGRETRFDTIPSSIASQTIIRKAVTADMPGETVAGNINIVTRSPFDYPGLKGALDAGYGFNDLGQGKQYNLSGFLSDRFANDTLGVLVGASRYERDMVTDNFENDWEIASEDQEPGGQNRIWASKHQNKLYRLKRSNTSYSGRLEWRPDGDNKLFLSSIYSQFRDDELRNAWVFDLDQDAKKTGSSTVGKTTGYADIRNGNTPAQGTLYGAEIESTLNSNSSRQSIFTNTLAGEHEMDSWKLRWRANYTRADDRSKPPFGSSWSSPSDFTRRPTLVYDFTDPNLPKVQLFNTVLNADGTYGAGASRPYISPTELNFLAMTRNRQLDRTNAYTAKLDVEHTLDPFGANTVVQFGGEYDKRIKTSTRVVQEVTPATLANAKIARPTQADISIDTPYKGKLPLGYGWKYFSSELGEALFDRYLAAGAVQVQANTSEQNNYRVSEEVVAGYAMGTTYFDWGNVVYGARIEHIRNVGSALSLIGDDWTPTRVSNSFTSVYPSIHVNWDINRDMKLRLSGNTGAARPNYDALRPNFSYSDVEQTVSGGNPRAKPERAKGVDLYFEWYMPSRGFFSVGGYYKDLRDILYDVELPAFGSDALNTTGVDRSAYRYATIANGGGGHIKGLEFAFSQPFEGLARSMGLADWAQGFGIQANLTLNDSKATTPDGRITDLPGASPLIYNVSGYYERYGFSARLSYQWQKAYLDSLGAGDIIGDAYWADVARLDASLRYSINEHVQLYVDANNLTNEPGIRYQGDYSRLIEHETFGRRYLAGVRINF